MSCLLSFANSLLVPETLLRCLQRFIHCQNQIKQIHPLLITTGCLSKNFTNLETLYPSKWKTTLIYNTLMRSYLNMGQNRIVFILFSQMIGNGVAPIDLTFPSVIKAASFFPISGIALHSQALKWGVIWDPFVKTSFLRLYSQVGDLGNARKMFEEISDPCIVACNAMLDAFGRNGDMESACLFFETMTSKDAVSWTSVINGFLKNNNFTEAVKVFAKMIAHEEVISGLVKPNEANWVSILSCCTHLDRGGFSYGKQIHGYIIRKEIRVTSFVGTSLIDLYGKAGCVETAIRVFNQIESKKVCTWNAMLYSLACNGQEIQAVDMFELMKVQGQCPNKVTFVVVLTACARAKLVELGLELFRSMPSMHGITPIIEHYGCVVDLLGRAGLLREANEFIRSMPFEADPSILGALLGACKIHGAAQLGNEIGQRILEMQPHHSGLHMALWSINASRKKWGFAADLRKAMVDAGVKKIPAYSLIGSI